MHRRRSIAFNSLTVDPAHSEAPRSADDADHGRIGGGHRALPLRHGSYRVDEMRKSAKARTTNGRPEPASRPGVTTTPVPEVTIKGRSEPASAEPRVSMACLSASQLAAYFEESWINAV